MTQILLANGQAHDLRGMHPDPGYTIDTIAHHLAQIVRFTGATHRPYTVAEHSLLCADIAADMGLNGSIQLCCLMHDAHEAITGDVSSPVKWLIGHGWENFERSQMNTLRRHFHLCAAFTAYRHQVKRIDLIALATERRDLLNHERGMHEGWHEIDTPGQIVEPHSTSLTTMQRTQRHWTEWRDLFMQRYNQLTYVSASDVRTTGATQC